MPEITPLISCEMECGDLLEAKQVLGFMSYLKGIATDRFHQPPSNLQGMKNN